MRVALIPASVRRSFTFFIILYPFKIQMKSLIILKVIIASRFSGLYNVVPKNLTYEAILNQ